MQSTRTALAVAAALLMAPAAMAQTQPQPGSGSGSGTGTPPATTGTLTPPSSGMPSGVAPGTAPPGTAAQGSAAAPRDAGPPTTATPAAGANSFTEGQARRRIEDAGYTEVKELRKDDQGVWRGRAMHNGTEAEVGLDFQGKVVTGSAPAAR